MWQQAGAHVTPCEITKLQKIAPRALKGIDQPIIHRNSTYKAFRYNVNAPAGFQISMTTRDGGMDRHESLYCAGKRRPPFIMPRELFTIIKTRSYGSGNLVQARWTTNSSCMLVNPVYQGCAGRPFFPRGGARVKIRGAGRGGAGRKRE